MSKITLKTNKSLNNYICSNEAGQTINIGNDGTTVGPMDSVLMAIAGCSSIDVVLILEKMKQDLVDIAVEIDGSIRQNTSTSSRTVLSISITRRALGNTPLCAFNLNLRFTSGSGIYDSFFSYIYRP